MIEASKVAMSTRTDFHVYGEEMASHGNVDIVTARECNHMQWTSRQAGPLSISDATNTSSVGPLKLAKTKHGQISFATM